MNKKLNADKLSIQKVHMQEIYQSDGENEIHIFIKILELQNLIIEKMLEPIKSKSDEQIEQLPEPNNSNP
jgi:hypothetical protein